MLVSSAFPPHQSSTALQKVRWCLLPPLYLHLTHLLDVSNLGFFDPPHNVSIFVYDSPSTGIKFMVPHAPSTPCWSSASSTATPSPTSSIRISPVEQPTLSARTIHVKRSLSQLNTKQFPYPSIMVAVPPDLDLSEPSFGELNAYPLRHSSIICKVIGGGCWELKNSPPELAFGSMDARPPTSSKWSAKILKNGDVV